MNKILINIYANAIKVGVDDNGKIVVKDGSFYYNNNKYAIKDGLIVPLMEKNDDTETI